MTGPRPIVPAVARRVRAIRPAPRPTTASSRPLLSPVLLGERPTRLEILSVPISLLGSALFFAGDIGEGNLAALGASVSYRLLIMSYRELSGGEGLTATGAGAVMVVVMTAPFALEGPNRTSAGRSRTSGRLSRGWGPCSSCEGSAGRARSRAPSSFSSRPSGPSSRSERR